MASRRRRRKEEEEELEEQRKALKKGPSAQDEGLLEVVHTLIAGRQQLVLVTVTGVEKVRERRHVDPVVA